MQVCTPEMSDTELVTEARHLQMALRLGARVYVPLVSTDPTAPDRAEVNFAAWPAITVRRYREMPENE